MGNPLINSLSMFIPVNNVNPPIEQSSSSCGVQNAGRVSGYKPSYGQFENLYENGHDGYQYVNSWVGDCKPIGVA